MTALLPKTADASGLLEQSFAMNSPEYRKLEAEFDRIWSKYGYKSMVMDKRRRVSTRKANQKGQQAVARAEKRAERDRLRTSLIAELSH